MNWQKGRQLASATNGTTSVAYTYDSEGLRLTKATGDLVYHYYYADGKLVRIHLYKGSTFWQIFDFFYDQNGHPYALNHKVGGVYTTYYYLTNLQGDVLGMVKADGTTVAAYTYDPYGKPLTATGTFAATNPLRYRGYCYDTETGLYYLQSRYYDPTTARFLNADTFASTGQGLLGNNMFAYCLNNPVNLVDYDGKEPITISVSVVVLGVVVLVLVVDLGAQAISSFLNWLSTQWYYSFANISFTSDNSTTDETLPQQGEVSKDPDAPPVDAGKQGKHVPGHNNYDDSKSPWPEGQTGVSQTQEAWQNGVSDPKVPSGNVRIGIASDGTVVRVHIDAKGRIHGYPLLPN